MHTHSQPDRARGFRGTDVMVSFNLFECCSAFSWIPASAAVPGPQVRSLVPKETVMGRGDEAVSEAAGLSSRDQRQDSRDLVLGLYGGVGQTGSKAMLLSVLRTLPTECCAISASPLGPLVGSWSEEALERK